MNPYHHAVSSVKRYGGQVRDYIALHDWFDQTKRSFADFRHRALRHHAEGIFECEALFGPTITNSDGRVIPTRWIGEQHVMEDCGRIPNAADWLRCLKPEGWMFRVAVTHQEIETMTIDTTAEAKRLDDLATKHTLWLLKTVYTAVHEATESFEHDDLVGPDLAYLMGSMLDNTYSAWPEDRPIVQLLRNLFPERHHPVWNFIEIETEDDDVLAEAASA